MAAGYFIYCRKSSESEDRQVLSIESQINELKQLAEKLGLPILDVLTESKSAKDPGRPVFNQLMQRIHRGDGKGIICWKLDRLARNPMDGGSVIWAIKQNGIRIVTPAQSFSREDDNLILMYIEFGMAQKYVDDLSKNVKRGLKTKVEKGWYPGVAPVGYLNHLDRKTGNNIVIKDPNLFPLIRRMWDLMLTGCYTPPRILHIANHQWNFRTRSTRKMGGKKLSRTGIYQIFTRSFYYGSFEYPQGSGNWYEGRHDPMITKEEFDKVQRLLKRSGSPRPKAYFEIPYTGMIRCGECNSTVVAEEKHQLICPECRLKFAYRTHTTCPRCKIPIKSMHQPKILHYTYYHCLHRNPRHPCRQKSITLPEMEKQIIGFLDTLVMPDELKDWAIKQLKQLQEKEEQESSAKSTIRHRALQDCSDRLNALLRLHTSPANQDGSLLSESEYATQRQALLKEKSELESSIANAKESSSQFQEVAKMFTFGTAARKRFIQGDFTVKQELIQELCSNLILTDKILRFSAKKPFDLMQSDEYKTSLRNRMFEPDFLAQLGFSLPS